MHIETYLDSYNNKNLSIKILSTFKYFGYINQEIFTIDLNLLLENIYTDIKLVEDKKIRLEQQQFRIDLLKLYKKCIISDNDCHDEITACHIVPFSENGETDITNGILLENNLHNTYDKYEWSINPVTMTVEIDENTKARTIRKYIGKKIDIVMNPFLYMNLQHHYDRFIEKKLRVSHPM